MKRVEFMSLLSTIPIAISSGLRVGSVAAKSCGGKRKTYGDVYRTAMTVIQSEHSECMKGSYCPGCDAHLFEIESFEWFDDNFRCWKCHCAYYGLEPNKVYTLLDTHCRELEYPDNFSFNKYEIIQKALNKEALRPIDKHEGHIMHMYRCHVVPVFNREAVDRVDNLMDKRRLLTKNATISKKCYGGDGTYENPYWSILHASINHKREGHHIWVTTRFKYREKTLLSSPLSRRSVVSV